MSDLLSNKQIRRVVNKWWRSFGRDKDPQSGIAQSDLQKSITQAQLDHLLKALQEEEIMVKLNQVKLQ